MSNKKNGTQESKEEKRNANSLTDNALQEEIDQVNIIPSIKSDHSAILLSINGIEEQTHGPSFWKFNTSLLDDKDYVALINGRYEVWIEEFKDIQDPRLLWDLIKYKIRQDTISYSKCKARERKVKMANLEENLKNFQVLCDQDPSPENVNRPEILKTEYDLQYEYIAQGAIIRSRARWYEQGEKRDGAVSERSPPTNVARVRFPDSASYVG